LQACSDEPHTGFALADTRLSWACNVVDPDHPVLAESSAQHPEMNLRTTPGFVASHARDATYERGLRSFFEYRDLGVSKATQGRVLAHVIRAAAATSFSSQAHRHQTDFQLVYVLKGWIEFEYEGEGIVRLEAGSCVHQPPNIRHRELGHSDDVEMLELVLPAGFTTEVVASVNGQPDGQG
jgi:quercetin dioxygenase-like cupin family protein